MGTATALFWLQERVNINLAACCPRIFTDGDCNLFNPITLFPNLTPVSARLKENTKQSYDV